MPKDMKGHENEPFFNRARLVSFFALCVFYTAALRAALSSTLFHPAGTEG